MKFFLVFLFFANLIPMSAHAGKEGGAGDPCEREFKALSKDARDWWVENRPYFEPSLAKVAAKVDPDKLVTDIVSRNIDCRPQNVEWDGLAKTSISDTRTDTIPNDLTRWNEVGGVGRLAHVLHEGLVLQNIESTGYYPFSGLLQSDNKALWAGTIQPSDQPDTEFRVNLTYQQPKEIVSEGSVGDFPAQFSFRYAIRITDKKGDLVYYNDGESKYALLDYWITNANEKYPIATNPDFGIVEKDVKLGDKKYYLDFRVFTASGVIERDGHYVLLRPEAGASAIAPDEKKVASYLGETSGGYTTAGYINVSEYSLESNPYTGSGEFFGVTNMNSLTVSPVSYPNVSAQLSFPNMDCGGPSQVRFDVKFNDTDIPVNSKVFVKYSYRKNPDFGNQNPGDSPQDKISGLSGSWENVKEEQMFPTTRGSEWAATLVTHQEVQVMVSPENKVTLSLEDTDLDYVFRIVKPDGKEIIENGNFSEDGRYRADLSPFQEKCVQADYSEHPLTTRSLVIQ